MIKTLIVENFRSIKKIEMDLGNLNFLIGSNNAGKSNIMKALDVVLGETYPSVRSFNDKDFYDYSKTDPIRIEVRFDSPLTSDHRVFGFLLTYDGAEATYCTVSANGNVITYGNQNQYILRVSSAMKEEVSLLYLGLDRQASQQVRASQWTLYGKLLRYIEKQIPDATKQAFKRDIQTTYDANIAGNLQDVERLLKEHVKKQTGLDLRLRLSVMDPIEAIKNLKPYISEGNASNEYDAEDMGSGTQSALTVAIAQAYGQIVRKPLILAIEEPELYMHPHGCRHFRRILKELADVGVQIICTTHESCFIELSQFETIHLVRKENGLSNVYSGINHVLPGNNQLATITKFSNEINEVFFSRCGVLVEGPADRVACQLALECLGFDVDQECVSIVECGSNTAIEPIARVLKLFNIPVIALVDEDPGNPDTAAVIAKLQTLLGVNKVLLQSPKLEALFGLNRKLTRADSMLLLPAWFSNNTPQAVYQILKVALV